MNTLLQSQVFFFISSLGFVVLWIFTGVFLYYLIRATKTFGRIIEKAEDDINEVGDTTKEMFEEIKDSAVFNFLFKKKKRNKKDKK